MRRASAVAALITATSAVAALAWAQEPVRPLDASQLEWDQTARDFARHYPQSAINRRQPGIAVVCCTLNERRRLECETAFEAPEGQGFGAATIAVAGEYRLSQASYDRIMASPDRNRPIQRTIRWFLPDAMTPELRAEFDRISAATENICAIPSPVALDTERSRGAG